VRDHLRLSAALIAGEIARLMQTPEVALK
jgi:hypothetical protein